MLAGDVRCTRVHAIKDETLADGVSDRWTVLGQAYEEDERLTVRRT